MLMNYKRLIGAVMVSAGDDSLFGNAGDDNLQGGPGDDYLNGGPHMNGDNCNGGPGVNTLVLCNP